MPGFSYEEVLPDVVAVHFDGTLVGILHRVPFAGHSEWMLDGADPKRYRNRGDAASALVFGEE
jgi:hypothetical protein